MSQPEATPERFSVRREALAVLAWGVLPAVVFGWWVWDWVRLNSTYMVMGDPYLHKFTWAAQAERFLLVPVEVAAGLSAALAVLVLVAVVRWRLRASRKP